MHNKEQGLIGELEYVYQSYVYQTCIPNFQKQNNNLTHLTKKCTHTP